MSEYLALIGTDPGDIYDNLNRPTKDFPGYFMPDKLYVNDEYLGAISKGIGMVFFRGTINEIDPYQHKFHSVECVAAEVRKYPDLLQYFPQRWYRKGELEGCLKMEDRTFIYSIFAKVRPNEYDAFMLKQEELHTNFKDASEPDTIEIVKELYTKLKKQDKTYYKTGRSGQKICNAEKTLKRKRACAQDYKMEAMADLIKDKVWHPPNNLEEVAEPSIVQDLVLSCEYQKVRKLYLNIHQDSLKFVADAQKIPWLSTRYIEDQNIRFSSYNHLKELMGNEFSWAHVKIPSYNEAYNLWNNDGQ